VTCAPHVNGQKKSTCLSAGALWIAFPPSTWFIILLDKQDTEDRTRGSGLRLMLPSVLGDVLMFGGRFEFQPPGTIWGQALYRKEGVGSRRAVCLWLQVTL
jgi:hypothetical protein